MSIFRRKSKIKVGTKVESEVPFELHRTLPNPLYAELPRRNSSLRRGGQVGFPPADRGEKFGRELEAKPKRRWKKAILSLFILLAVAAAGYGGWVGWKFTDNAVHIFGWRGLFSLFWPSKLKGEDTGRVNILLAGDSSDDPGHQGADLTDSIMLVSINTRDNTAYMLSIPRDLYVNIPGFGYAKINEAYQDGNQEHFSQPGYAAGGMGLLEEVVSQKFGVPVDYYALVDYTAFRDSVNAVGGITVNIQSEDPRGLYDPSIDWTTHGPLVNLTNGEHSLNGEQALDLARARGDAYGSYGFPRADFDRTTHQRQMLLALKDKATSFSVLANPIRFGELLDSVGKNVKTDMSLGNVRRLYNFSKKIPSSKIQSASLNDANLGGQKDVDLLGSYFTSTGQDALVPAAGLDNYTQIDDYVQQLDNK